MNRYDGLIRFIFSCICCVFVITICFFNNLPNIENKTVNEKSESGIPELFFPEKSSNNLNKNTEDESSQPESTSNESVTTAVSGGGKVLGKITERFITPYTANTSYNNVYLKNSTDISLNLQGLLEASLPFKIEKNQKPQVLIMHTHTTESFMTEERDYYTENDKARTTDENYNNARLGGIVAEKLNNAGIVTLHDKTKHDYPEYNGSYSRSAATVKKYLKENPSIKIVIDMHRDAVSTGDNGKAKLVSTINGKKAAQIMLVIGSQNSISKNKRTYKENLKLATKLQQTLEAKYPTLARSILFTTKNYNQNLTNGSLLIEIGTDANTIDEVCYSAELLGDALTELLNRLD